MRVKRIIPLGLATVLALGLLLGVCGCGGRFEAWSDVEKTKFAAIAKLQTAALENPPTSKVSIKPQDPSKPLVVQNASIEIEIVHPQDMSKMMSNMKTSTPPKGTEDYLYALMMQGIKTGGAVMLGQAMWDTVGDIATTGIIHAGDMISTVNSNNNSTTGTQAPITDGSGRTTIDDPDPSTIYPPATPEPTVPEPTVPEPTVPEPTVP